ncbi:hypothetical protein B0H11DRAFT_2204222 [Mycena galericulata]|nr:hypothetical protein B0H11DRAFT_2204222 [Mycena galericulata]
MLLLGMYTEIMIAHNRIVRRLRVHISGGGGGVVVCLCARGLSEGAGQRCSHPGASGGGGARHGWHFRGDSEGVRRRGVAWCTLRGAGQRCSHPGASGCGGTPWVEFSRRLGGCAAARRGMVQGCWRRGGGGRIMYHPAAAVGGRGGIHSAVDHTLRSRWMVLRRGGALALVVGLNSSTGHGTIVRGCGCRSVPLRVQILQEPRGRPKFFLLVAAGLLLRQLSTSVGARP